MIRIALLRRLVSSLAIFMLVWCQTCAAAHAGLAAMSMSMSPPAAETAVDTPPCHPTAADSSDTHHQNNDCQTRCQSRDASFETAKIHLPALDDLPVAVVFTTLLAPVATCVAPNNQTVERAAPPPLILVYGRLLI